MSAVPLHGSAEENNTVVYGRRSFIEITGHIVPRRLPVFAERLQHAIANARVTTFGRPILNAAFVSAHCCCSVFVPFIDHVLAAQQLWVVVGAPCALVVTSIATINKYALVVFSSISFAAALVDILAILYTVFFVYLPARVAWKHMLVFDAPAVLAGTSMVNEFFDYVRQEVGVAANTSAVQYNNGTVNLSSNSTFVAAIAREGRVKFMAYNDEYYNRMWVRALGFLGWEFGFFFFFQTMFGYGVALKTPSVGMLFLQYFWAALAGGVLGAVFYVGQYLCALVSCILCFGICYVARIELAVEKLFTTTVPNPLHNASQPDESSA